MTAVCGLRGAVVSVVAFKTKGRGFKSTHGCSHTVKKPSISHRLFGQCTLNISLLFTIYHLHLPLEALAVASMIPRRRHDRDGGAPILCPALQRLRCAFSKHSSRRLKQLPDKTESTFSVNLVAEVQSHFNGRTDLKDFKL